MNKEEVLGRLKDALGEAPALLRQRYDSIERDTWYYRVVDILKAGFGADSDELKRFEECVPLTTYHGTTDELQRRSNRRLKKRTAALLSIIEKCELLGEEVRNLRVEAPKAFIAHGGQSVRLRKLCDFLRALGVEPVVAEWSESKGGWTEEHVNKLMEASDCVIILAEFGGIIDIETGAKHPRLNVIDELARSRKKRPSRTILLLEKGVDLPSNVEGIVYERFTKQNMEKAFIKVANELRAFGLIKATKGCK